MADDPITQMRKAYEEASSAAAQENAPRPQPEDPFEVLLKDFAHRRPTSEEDATRAARFIKDPLSPSFFPEIASTKLPPTPETIPVTQVLEEAGNLPGVRLVFSDSAYDVSVEALRMAQHQLEAAQQAVKTPGPPPELMIVSGENYGAVAGEWKFNDGTKAKFVNLPASLLERTVFNDSEASSAQGLVGPAHLLANFSEALASLTVPAAGYRGTQDWVKAVDAVAAKAADPCVLADALHASSVNYTAALLGEADSDDLSHMVDSTNDRIRALQTIAQQKGKPCKSEGRE